MRKLISLICLLLSPSAFAADMYVKAQPVPQPPAAFSWSGLYLYGFAGYGADLSAPDLAGITLGAIPNGPLLGGGLKALYQLSPSWVIGVAADTSWANMRGTSTIGQAFSLANTTNWLGCVCGQVGYLLDPKLLISVTGGFGYGGLKSEAALGPLLQAISETSVGYAVGGELDYALTDYLRVFTATRYYHLGGKSVTIAGAMTATTPFNDLTQMAGIAVQFSGK